MKIKALKKYLVVFILFVSAILLVSLCSCEVEDTTEERIIVKDVQGTEFTFDEPISKVVSTHNPTLNHVVVLGKGTSKYLAGFGNKDKANALYSQVLDDWNSLTVIGGNGNAVNKETIISLHPDLALVPENLASMKDKDYEGTGVKPFVAMPEKESFNTITDSLILISKLFGEEDRALQITDFFNNICNTVKSDLEVLDDKDKPRVLFMGTKLYTAASSDMIQTQIIENSGGVNCAKDEFESGFFADTDAETIVKLNPDVIYFPNYAKYNVNDLLNDPKLQSVKAIKDKKVYKFPSLLEPWDYPTCSACLGLAWSAYTLHPDLYSKEKLNSTCEIFYELLYKKKFSASQFGI